MNCQANTEGEYATATVNVEPGTYGKTAQIPRGPAPTDSDAEDDPVAAALGRPPGSIHTRMFYATPTRPYQGPCSDYAASAYP
ncbi:MAG: hypothetical protein HKN70_05590 [Gammaproteobacteria bacterium]|nr:hypothetical protein [Gammaproteobacteria bacterium]